MARRLESSIKNCFKNNNHNYNAISTRLFNKENNLLIQYNKNLIKIERGGDNEGEGNESEIDIKRDATSDDGDETTKDDYHSESPYRS